MLKIASPATTGGPVGEVSLDRWLVVGPDLAANVLEIIVLVTDEGDELIIHVMPLRPVHRRLLKP